MDFAHFESKLQTFSRHPATPKRPSILSEAHDLLSSKFMNFSWNIMELLPKLIDLSCQTGLNFSPSQFFDCLIYSDSCFVRQKDKPAGIDVGCASIKVKSCMAFAWSLPFNSFRWARSAVASAIFRYWTTKLRHDKGYQELTTESPHHCATLQDLAKAFFHFSTSLRLRFFFERTTRRPWKTFGQAKSG